LIRLNPDGSRDQSFVPFDQGCWEPTRPIRCKAFVLQGDGRLVVAESGYFEGTQAVEPRVAYRIVRLNPDGSLDPTFVPVGPSAFSELGVFRLLESADHLVLSGTFSSAGEVPQPYLARVYLEPSSPVRRHLKPSRSGEGSALRVPLP
jgi:hypothetical protein